MIDPDAILDRIRGLAGQIHAHWDGTQTLQPGQMDALAGRLADLVTELDQSLSDGGRPPTAWGGQP